MSDLKARIGKRLPHASCSRSFRQTGLPTPSHARHLEDALSSDLKSESQIFAGPKPNSDPASASRFSSLSRMDLGLDPPQLNGPVSVVTNGTGIPLIKRIHVSHEDTAGEDVKVGNQGSSLVLQTPTNALTDHTVGKATGDVLLSLQSDNLPVNIEGTTVSSSLEDPDPLRHESRFSCPQNSSSPYLGPAPVSEVLTDTPANDLRPATLSKFPPQGGMSHLPSSRPPSVPHVEEQIMDQPRIVPTLASRLREALHPVVMQNVQLRGEHTSDEILPKGVQDGAKSLLTDELCESFIAKMRSVGQEIQALKPDGPYQSAGITYGISSVNGHLHGPNGTTDSKDAPRSISEAIVSTSQNVTQSENEQMLVSFLPTPPVSASLTNLPKGPKATLFRENGWKGTSGVAPTAVSPHYSPSRKGKDRAYENSSWQRRDEGRTDNATLSAAQSEVLPSQYAVPPANHVDGPASHGIPIPMDPDFFSTPSTSVGEGKRRSHSSSPSRYSRPRRTSWRHPPSDRRSPTPHSQRHSPSPYRRPLSPTPDRRSPFRHRRSSSPYRHLPSPNHRLSSPHRHPSSSPHPYTSRRDGVARSPDRSYPRSLQFSPPTLNGGRHHAHRRSRSRSYSPRHSIDQDPDAKSYPDGNLGAYSQVTNSPKDHSILPSILNDPNQEDELPPMNSIQSANNTQGRLKPCHNVPGLWFVKTGYNGASITECEFEVDRETAVKWDLQEKPLPSSQTVLNHSPKVCLQLLCLPGGLVRSVYETSNLGAASPEAVAIAFSNIKTEWPVQGTLTVEVNSNMSCGKTWLPRHLIQIHPPLDLTGCICEGTNVVRLIQLTGLADKVFVLLAMPSPMDPSGSATADWEIIDWAEHVQHAPLNIRPAVVEVP